MKKGILITESVWLIPIEGRPEILHYKSKKRIMDQDLCLCFVPNHLVHKTPSPGATEARLAQLGKLGRHLVEKVLQIEGVNDVVIEKHFITPRGYNQLLRRNVEAKMVEIFKELIP